MSDNPNLQDISILILEEDLSSVSQFHRELQTFGADMHVTSTLRDALIMLSQEHVRIIIAALQFVDEKFIATLKDYKTLHPDCFFYVMTEPEYDAVEATSETVKLYVDDYVKKPLDALRFAQMVETNVGRPTSTGTSLTVVDPLVRKVKPYFIFRSSKMRSALRNLPEIAASGQTVLITGETGTGKEIVARSIHVLSPRSSHPFIAVNCSAIPESLIEAELFGHEKGAFTGAARTRKGKFETAHYGTLFLDEIGDMPLNLQTRLLRVLEEGAIYRIGGEGPVPIDVRVIAASHQDLKKAVNDSLFRQDLYYRLNILRIHLPPLRERVEDISLLAVHFLERVFGEMDWPQPFPSLSSETIYLLEHYPWKGNIRELRNIMTRVATMLPRDTKRIFPFHVLPHLEDEDQIYRPSEAVHGEEGVYIPLGTKMSDVEDMLIRETLNITDGNRTKAAKLLGISIRTLRRKLNK
jgi:DNA-binding NtrC family response regulator